MVRRCIVCRNVQNKNSPFSFHRFPMDENRHRQWIVACGLQNNITFVGELVCSNHFSQDDYDKRSWPLRRLNSTAIPHVFLKNHNNSSQVVLKEIAPVQNELTPLSDASDELSTLSDDFVEDGDSEIITVTLRAETPSPNSSLIDVASITMNHDTLLQEDSPPKLARYVGDLTRSHFSTPRRANRNFELISDTINKQRRKIKTLQVQNNRLRKSITSLKELLGLLKEEKSLSEESAMAISLALKKTEILK